jgi:hypothetical protein
VPADGRSAGVSVGLTRQVPGIISPHFSEPLEEGMVIALEPKFIFPGQGGCGTGRRLCGHFLRAEETDLDRPGCDEDCLVVSVTYLQRLLNPDEFGRRPSPRRKGLCHDSFKHLSSF